MDVLELSRKLEGNLLESKINSAYFKNTLSDSYNFRPRMTQSKVLGIENKDTIGNKISNERLEKSGKKACSLKNVYINKKEKVMCKNLETIYEHPILRKGNTMFVGTSKVKRSIYLDKEFRKVTKQKSKLRKIKIKKLGKKFKSFKMTDDEFKKKMLKIENFINDIDSEYDSYKNYEVDIEMEDNNKCQVENMKMELTLRESNDFGNNQDKNMSVEGKCLTV